MTAARTARRLAVAATVLYLVAVVLEVLRGLAIDLGWADEEDGRG